MSKKKIPSSIRKLVAKRAYGCCEYCMCQAEFDGQSFSIDHVYPESLGGQLEIKNLAYSCQGCNSFKYNKLAAIDPESGEVVPLFNPRKQIWSEHFSWNENFTIMTGLTPSGRATVKTLRLNRQGLINQRSVYYAFGIHPPAHTIV
jgi:hypothetical protein